MFLMQKCNLEFSIDQSLMTTFPLPDMILPTLLALYAIDVLLAKEKPMLARGNQNSYLVILAPWPLVFVQVFESRTCPPANDKPQKLIMPLFVVKKSILVGGIQNDRFCRYCLRFKNLADYFRPFTDLNS